MKARDLERLDRELTLFLEDLIRPMGRSERRYWARKYIQGLLLEGERKSIEPIAQRVQGDVQALRQFVSQSPWEVEAVQKPLALKAENLLEPQAWIIDETGFPKAGKHSVGVARQYCGTLGKIANCQVSVSLHLSGKGAACPVGWRLFLPKEWLEDTERAKEVHLPKAIPYKSKRRLALDLIEEALWRGLKPKTILADSFYGKEFAFRESLRQKHLPYVLEVEPSTVVWTTDPNGVSFEPTQGVGRPRQYAPLEKLPPVQNLLQVAKSLPKSAWKTLHWREGSRGKQQSRFARVKVWAAHGWKRHQRLERLAEWLLIEWPMGEEKPIKYWLGHFEGQEPTLKEMVCLAHGRWVVEVDYRQLKEELGLDHYEGRHWLGWHHHVTLVSIAYLFLRQMQKKWGKKEMVDVANSAPALASIPGAAERVVPAMPYTLCA